MIAVRNRLIRRAAAVVVATAVLTVGAGIGLAGSASAHDVLISSDPADGSTLQAVPSTVSFTFDQPVQNFDPVVSLVGPDGKQYATGSPQISGSVVTGNVLSGPAGAYTAAYRIVSADGHPVTGEVRFTLAAGAAPATGATAATGAGSPAGATGGTGTAPVVAPATPPTAAQTAVAVAARSSGGLSSGIWIGIIVAALLIAAAAVLLLRRPSRPDRDY